MLRRSGLSIRREVEMKIQVGTEQIDKMTESLYHILNGQKATPLELPEDYPEDELRQMVGYYNRFVEEFNEFTKFMYAISRGELEYEAPKGHLEILQSFKSMQANLKHLTWKTQQIARGDFNHKVDFIGDFSEAFNEMTRQLKDSFEQIQAQNKQLMEANRIIEREREKSDMLLKNILPDKIVDELKASGSTTPQLYKNVMVFFSDIIGFTDKSSQIEPAELIQELTSLFTAFDCIVDATYGERIKTIGDAYLAVWGMHIPVEDHAEKAAEAALKIIEYVRSRNSDAKVKWEVRVGMHIGDVVGGVVGTSKFIYDIFGDTVNTTSRMESNSESMKINISEDVYQLVKERFVTSERGYLHAKGIGNMKMYFVEGKK